MAQARDSAGRFTSGNGQRAITWNLPAIPLWVPTEAQAAILDLEAATVRLALQEVAGQVSDEAPVDTGHLAQSFGADPANQYGGIELLNQTPQEVTGHVFSTLPYAIVMDQGRGANKPISRVGIDAIGLWAQRKLGLSADQAERAKWAIAAHIIARGIAGTDFVDKGWMSAQPRIQQLFDVLTKQIGEALTRAKRG